jgi:hypothetical protein
VCYNKHTRKPREQVRQKQREREGKETMKKLITIVIMMYLLASCVFSIGHALTDQPWSYRAHRNGLLCVEVAEDGVVIYSPFCNHGDVFLFGLCHDEEGWRTFSDGFYCFGEWDVE